MGGSSIIFSNLMHFLFFNLEKWQKCALSALFHITQKQYPTEKVGQKIFEYFPLRQVVIVLFQFFSYSELFSKQA